MELRNRIVGAIGATALLLGMTAGMASAQVVDTDSMEATVTIECDSPMTVALGGNADLATITDIATQSSTSTAPGAIQVIVDMGCYWGPWQVNASITNFSAGLGLWFGADHFSLEDATVETYFLAPIDFLGILEPTANDAYFYGPTDEDTILETAENWFFFWQLPDSPAPFVTEASYTGHLSDLPAYIVPGDYSATLTVELATD